MNLKDVLLDHLTANPKINDTYEVVKCINYPTNEERRGMFSIVFEALEIHSKKKIALKFFDPDGQDSYRRAAFEREPLILTKLLGKKRGLQLTNPIGIEQLKVPLTLSNSRSIEIDFSFFSIEWVEYDIDHFFLFQENVEALSKLYLFKETAKAINELHRENIFHRDIKFDNLRSTKIDKDQIKIKKDGIVKAIDLGTAARLSDANIKEDYRYPVGAILCSPPEAFIGLGGIREIASCSDFYALGCLLFSLFNKEYFFHLQQRVPEYKTALALLSTSLLFTDIDDRLSKWREIISDISLNYKTPSICGNGSSAPKGVSDLLDKLVRGLTHLNFENRICSFDNIQSTICVAIRILENERSYKMRLEQRKEHRKRRVEKILEKQNKLDRVI